MTPLVGRFIPQPLTSAQASSSRSLRRRLRLTHTITRRKFNTKGIGWVTDETYYFLQGRTLSPVLTMVSPASHRRQGRRGEIL